MMLVFLICIGLGISAPTLAAMLWSVAFPKRRLWPPQHYTSVTPILVWVPTLLLFGILIILGAFGWGELAFPDWIRFGAGIPLIVIGNIVVWSEVAHFGMHQTGGAKGTLRTQGAYRYSRNPQYMADIGMIIGWILLSSAPWVPVVGLACISILIAAPFAEEPWLEEQYGTEFDAYRETTRRFI